MANSSPMDDNTSFTIRGCLIWGMCVLFFIYEFSLRTILGTFQHQIVDSFEISASQFAFLSTTIFLSTYGLLQVPGGMLLDRIGLKKFMIISGVLCTFATLGFAYSATYSMALLFRFLMAVGAAGAYIATMISVYEWMPKRHTGLFVGISQFVGTLGPMFTTGPLDAAAQSGRLSWSTFFVIASLFTLGIAILSLLIVKRKTVAASGYVFLNRPNIFGKDIGALFKRLQPWLIALFSGAVYFTVEYLSENEGRHFLALKGLTQQFIGNALTLSWVGYAMASPLLGFLSDHFQRRKVFMIIAGSCIVIGLGFLLLSHSPILLSLGFFIIGVGAAGQTLGVAMMSEQFPKKYLAIGFGLNNTVLALFSASNAPLIGWILTEVQKDHVLSLEDYYLAFSPLLLSGIISVLVVACFIKESFCKSQIDFTYVRRSNS